MGILSAPSLCIARSRMTPVVVSSVPPRMFPQKFRMLLMNGRDEVGAVVHREYRLLCYKRFDVFEECIRTFSLYGKCRDFVDSCECCGDIVLRRKRVRGRKKYIPAPPAFSVRMRLAVSAVTCNTAATVLPLNGCSFSNRARALPQYGHIALRPLDAAHTRRREALVFNIGLHLDNYTRLLTDDIERVKRAKLCSRASSRGSSKTGNALRSAQGAFPTRRVNALRCRNAPVYSFAAGPRTHSHSAPRPRE